MKSRSSILEAMAEVLDELGYPKEVTKEEVVSAFCQVIDSNPQLHNNYATSFWNDSCMQEMECTNLSSMS